VQTELDLLEDCTEEGAVPVMMILLVLAVLVHRE
jgi:hypothetical protein